VVSNRVRLWTKIVVIVYFAALILPLVTASVARPFGWWDYLSTPDLFHYGSPTTAANLVPHYWLALTTHTYLVRPTSALLYDLQYLLFGGEFWIWYLAKWAVKFGAVYLAFLLLRRIGVCDLAGLAAAVFLLFHPAELQLMLFAPDGWAALGMLAVLLLLLPAAGEDRAPFDVSALSRKRYAALLAVWVLTLGAKEVAFAFCGLLTLAMTWTSRDWRRLAPFFAGLALWTWRLTAASGRVGSASVEGLWRNVQAHVAWLFPWSPWHILDGLLVALLALAAVRARHWDLRGRLTVFCLAAAAGMLIMTSLVPAPASRYVIPLAFLLAIPIGIALDEFRWRSAAAWTLILIYPIATASDIYSQELAYQQQFYGYAGILHLLDAKVKDGYKAVTSGDPDDFGLENQHSVCAFLTTYGPEWYGRKPAACVEAAKSGWPREKFVLLTRFFPSEVNAGRLSGLDLTRLEWGATVERGGYGILGRMAGSFRRLDAALDNEHAPRWDSGASSLSDEPEYSVYTFRAADDPPPPAYLTAGTIRGGSEESYRLKPGRTLRFSVPPNEVWTATVPLGHLSAGVTPRYTGRLAVEAGAVELGIRNNKGLDVWKVTFRPARDPQPLPQAPGLAVDPRNEYWLFFRADRPSAFRLDDFQILSRWEYERRPPPRRYGALMW